MTSNAKVAFVTGANGITGSAIARHLCEKTTSDEFRKIIITSRSPLTLPFSDPRLSFVALDFSKSPAELQAAMQDAGCKDVSHAYFSSYVHNDDFNELNKANEALFENFLQALVGVAAKLQNVTLQTGGKHYYVHLMPVPTPAREEEARITDAPLANFYFPQEDALMAAAKAHKFGWNVIRPEAIIGSTHKPNGMNEALTIAMYFILCAEQGVEAVMPTNQRYWEGTEDVSDARSIADLTLYVSTTASAHNNAFNHNNGDYFSWRHMWPRLAAHFGAKASSRYAFQKPYPKEGDLQLEVSLNEWANTGDRRAAWDGVCEKYGAQKAKQTWAFGTWAFQDWVFQRTWSATLSVNKARKHGWTHHVDSHQSFVDAFDDFVALGLLPDTKKK